MRYYAVASALRLFSMNTLTKKLYRRIGNTSGAKRRMTLGQSYLDRAAWLNTHVQDLLGGRRLRVLELGTGWMHFYGLYLWLFNDVELVLYDVWDNRQFNTLQANFSQLRDKLSPADLVRVDQKLNTILSSPDFESLYANIGIEYVIDHYGSLKMMQSESFDLIFSVDVLEHVIAGDLPDAVKEYHRLLKPSGISLHQVGVDDHIAHYVPQASRKEYLRFSDKTWNRFIVNDVQYTKRASFDQFRAMFNEAGFEEIEASATREPDQLTGLEIAEQFRSQSQESLEATRVFIVHRK